MDSLKKTQAHAISGIKKNQAHTKAQVSRTLHATKSHLTDAVNDLLVDGKKLLHHAEDHLNLQSDELISKIKENPMTSVFIAAGTGFLLSILLRK